ncbi:MAG: RHS repeat-associated core domain-containing protein [Pseudomonadota bacterium]
MRSKLKIARTFLASLAALGLSSAFAQSGTTREYSTAYVQGPLGPVAKIVTTITRATTCVQVTCPPAPKTAALQTKAATVPGGTCQSCSTSTTTDTKKFWLHTDHQGSVHVESNNVGVEAARFTYKPYGDHLGTNSSLPGPESLGYTGQRQDSSTGLLYLHARYYDPVLGRFISPDPIVPGNLTVHLNRYAYADNDPINKTDVNGMQAGGGTAGPIPFIQWDKPAVRNIQLGMAALLFGAMGAAVAPELLGLALTHPATTTTVVTTIAETVGAAVTGSDAPSVLPQGKGAVQMAKAMGIGGAVEAEAKTVEKIAARSFAEIRKVEGAVCRHCALKTMTRLGTEGILPTGIAAVSLGTKEGHIVVHGLSSTTGVQYMVDNGKASIVESIEEVTNYVSNRVPMANLRQEFTAGQLFNDLLEAGEGNTVKQLFRTRAP